MKKKNFNFFNFFNLKGPFLSLDSSMAVKRFFYLLSSSCFSKSISDFRNSFLPTTSFYNINFTGSGVSDIKKFYNFFLFGVNTRFESPVFNLKIKEMLDNSESYNASSLAFSFGFSFNNNFSLNCLDNNFYFLVNKISGLNYNNAQLLHCEKLFFFVFGSKASVFDSYLKYLLQAFLGAFNNTSINLIHICSSSNLHSLEEIGYSACGRQTTAAGYNNYFPSAFMDFGGNYISKLKSSAFNLSCYFGHHGGNFLKAFNLILPVKFFYEKSLSYINTEGYFQKIGFLKIDYKYHYIKSEKKILDIFGKVFNIDSYRLNLEKFYKIGNVIPEYDKFSKNNFFIKFFVYNFYIKLVSLKHFFFINSSSTINDYFLSDYVSSNSVTMSLCSKKFTVFNDFIFIFINAPLNSK
eukprot:TRINITY_DN115_c0_g1_i12.p1 TRINITY_DN115_c0_g1~~TRINITY_DN115_c0_g1_i12.p1  ORF type:complete len:408 (-),score=43.88 TRINITY_DN115_c0_g1_i12:1605-2828(-)